MRRRGLAYPGSWHCLFGRLNTGCSAWGSPLDFPTIFVQLTSQFYLPKGLFCFNCELFHTHRRVLWTLAYSPFRNRNGILPYRSIPLCLIQTAPPPSLGANLTSWFFCEWISLAAFTTHEGAFKNIWINFVFDIYINAVILLWGHLWLASCAQFYVFKISSCYLGQLCRVHSFSLLYHILPYTELNRPQFTHSFYCGWALGLLLVWRH